MKIDFKDVYKTCKEHPETCVRCPYNDHDGPLKWYCDVNTGSFMFPEAFETYKEYKKALVKYKLKQL